MPLSTSLSRRMSGSICSEDAGDRVDTAKALHIPYGNAHRTLDAFADWRPAKLISPQRREIGEITPVDRRIERPSAHRLAH